MQKIDTTIYPKKKAYIDVLKNLSYGCKSVNRNKVYVEIGIFKGVAFNRVAIWFKEAYAVDVNPECLKYINHNKNLKWNNVDSDTFFENWDKDKQIDFAFIDGDHSYEQSLKDFQNTARYLRRGGLIAMHDTYPENEQWMTEDRCFEAYKTAEYIRNNLGQEFEIITLPFYHGLSLIRKSDVQLDWKDR